MTAINPDSFEVTRREETAIGDKVHVREEGTVEVTLGRTTKRVEATRYVDGAIIARGLIGQHRTGAKRWSASLYYQPRNGAQPYEYACFGRDDRSGKFNKMKGLSFKE